MALKETSLMALKQSSQSVTLSRVFFVIFNSELDYLDLFLGATVIHVAAVQGSELHYSDVAEWENTNKNIMKSGTIAS